MFIYHFSRLIKSKVLWGLLALLMVFAFVVADSCSGTSTDATLGKLGGTSVGQTTVRDAEYVLVALGNPQAMMAIPNRGYQIKAGMIQPAAVSAAGENMGTFWQLMMRAPLENEEAETKARERHMWKLLAAREVGAAQGFTVSTGAGQDALAEVFTTPEAGFRREAYGQFLMTAGVQADPQAFEEAYANVWVPAQSAVMTVANSVAWVSPMERAFMYSAMNDQTTAQAAVLKNTLDPNALTVSDEEVQAWYDAHVADYAVPEQREIAYIEIPTEAFIEKAVVTEDDAMQYYEDHPEQFKGTNETDTLPFIEARGKAIAEMKKVKALDDALAFAQVEAIEVADVKGLDALKDKYGEVKTTTVREDRPYGFQNAAAVIEGAFLTDTESIRFNAVKGTDRVYFMELKKVIPAHTAALADVRDRVLREARQDLLQKKLLANGETARALIAEHLAQGKNFKDAVAACAIADFAATDAVQFVASENPTLTIPHARDVIRSASELGVGMLSKPVVVGDDVLFTYVVTRTPKETLLQATELATLAKMSSEMQAVRLTQAWLDWNLDREPPTTVTGIPLLDDSAED